MGGQTMPTELLNKAEIAERLGVHPETIAKWAREKRIPEIRISPKGRRFDFDEVIAALKKRSSTCN
jgi:excisionase family DNA binding protein